MTTKLWVLRYGFCDTGFAIRVCQKNTGYGIKKEKIRFVQLGVFLMIFATHKTFLPHIFTHVHTGTWTRGPVGTGRLRSLAVGLLLAFFSDSGSNHGLLVLRRLEQEAPALVVHGDLQRLRAEPVCNGQHDAAHLVAELRVVYGAAVVGVELLEDGAKDSARRPWGRELRGGRTRLVGRNGLANGTCPWGRKRP